MIWTSIVPPKPETGDLKIVHRFAWWPRQIGNHKVWLESYEQLYEYTYRKRTMIIGRFYGPPIMCNGWDLIGEKIMRGIPHPDTIPPPPGSSPSENEAWKKYVNEKTKRRFNAV